LPAAAQREIVLYQFTRAFPLALYKDWHILLTLKEMQRTPRKMQVYASEAAQSFIASAFCCNLSTPQAYYNSQSERLRFLIQVSGGVCQ